MNELAALFAPGKRHELAERQRREVLRDDDGNAADPPSTVDLDRGVAVIRLARRDQHDPLDAGDPGAAGVPADAAEAPPAAGARDPEGPAGSAEGP